MHGQQVVGRRERRVEADLGQVGPAGGRGASAPDVVSRERGTATQRSSNSGRYSGAYRSVSSSLNPSLDSEVG